MAKYNNIAGTIFTFRRHKYLKRTVKSLEKANKNRDVDWYAFVDGPVNKITGVQYAKQKEIDKCVKILENSKLPIKKIFKSEYNICIDGQKNKSFQLYDDYDLIYFFEDDLLVSPHYLKLLYIACFQFPEHMILMNKHFNNGPLDTLEECNIARVWGSAMTRRLYHKIKDGWKEWYARAQTVDYRAGRRERAKVLSTWLTHDVALTNLTRKYGNGKLWPCNTRGHYIGKKGDIAYTDFLWKKNNMADQPKNYIYKSDANLDRFKVR